MKIIKLIGSALGVSLMLSITSFGTSFAAESATVFKPSCVLDHADPFDLGWALAGGPNAGKCLDTTQKRSVVQLPNGPAGQNGMITIANFAHNGKFWIASIDPNGIDEVIFQVDHFPAAVPAAHAQIRFKMKRGREVSLVEQDASGAEPRQARQSVRDFVYSVEAVESYQGGENFDIFKGLERHFGLAYRFVSMADRFRDMITIDHHLTQQYSLKLSDADKSRLLQNAVNMSEKFGMKYYYNTLTRSCTTEAFRLLDQTMHLGLGEEIQSALGKIILDQTNPIEAPLGLSNLGLLKPRGQSELPNVDADRDLISELAREKTEQ